MSKYIRSLIFIVIISLYINFSASAITYTYDPLNRLIEAAYDNGQKINYTYDAGGNILSIILTSPPGLAIPPVLDRIGNKSAAEGTTLSFTLTAFDNNGDPLTFSATGLPRGATLDPMSGEFRWTPDYTRAGRYAVRYTVSDGALTDSEDVLLTVLDATPAVSLAIGDVSIDEGRTGPGLAVFTVTLSAPSPWDVTVDYATVDGTAGSPGDYTAQAGRLIFPAGATSQNVSILVNGDAEDEPDESFTVCLAGAANTTIAKGRGTCTILNDDQGAVTVKPVDTATGLTPVTLIFSQIVQAGETTLITSATGPPPPAGFRLGDPSVYYELSTTAVFTGPIDVWIDYTGSTFANESALRLFHYEGGAWVDRTVSLDTAHNLIRGRVDSLSPFAVFEPEPIPLPPAVITWYRAYGGGNEILQAVGKTPDGGYIAAGSTGSLPGESDCVVIRLNQLGNIVWQKTYGGPDFDEAQAVCAAADGGYVIAGRTGSFGAGGDDLWVLRLDADGEVLWQRAYGGQAGESAAALLATDDGGCLVAGATSSFGSGGEDLWLLRLDAAGNIVWQKACGGGLDDRARMALRTDDGGFLIAGESSSCGAGGRDGWLLRIDGQGVVVWQKTYGGAGDDAIASVVPCDEGYLAVGSTASYGLGNIDAWALRLDADGDMVWQKTYGGAGDDAACSAAVDGGGWVVGGLCASDLALWRISPDGAIDWQKIYGRAAGETDMGLVRAEDGGLVLAGTIAEGDGNSFLLVKTDGTGEVLSLCNLDAPGTSVSAGSGAMASASTLPAMGTAALSWETNAGVSATSWSGRLPCAGGRSFAVYIADSGGNSLSAYLVDGTGLLIEVPGSPFPAGVSPRAVAMDPTGRYAYVAGNDGLRVYAVDPATGGLHELPGSPFPAGAGTEAAAVHPSGRFVYAVNAHANTVSGYTVDVGGSLTEIPASPFPAGSYPRAMALDPLGRFAFVANSGAGTISAYTVDPLTGALVPVPGSPFRAGFVPLALAVDPFGRFLYAANSASDTLSVYRIDGATGALAEIAGSPFPVPAGPASLAVDPFGRYLCVLCDIERKVVFYALDAASGAPAVSGGMAAYVTSGGGAVAVDPSGRFVYVTAGYADHLAVYAVDPRQGSYAETAGSPYRTGSHPAGLAAAHQPVPAVSVSDARVAEGHAGTAEMVFTVSLSHAGADPVVVDYATADAAAGAGRDYLAVSGRLVFAPGVTSLTVSVTVLGDMEIEPDESLLLKLAGVSGAVVADGQGVGTIVNDDFNQPPVLEPIGNRTVDEGRTLTFMVRASDPDGDALTYAVANLPAGAAFDAATGAFRWTPDYTRAGTYAGVRFEVTDGYFTVSMEIVIVVRNVTPLDLVKALREVVSGLAIHEGTKQSLLGKLENVKKSLEKGQNKTAVNQLEAFVNEVQAQRGKKIPARTADGLIRAAKEIILLIGSG